MNSSFLELGRLRDRWSSLVLGALLPLLVFLCIPTLSLAQTDIYIRGSGRMIPIALPQLCNEGAADSVGRDIPRIMGRDLDLSGYFEVIDSGGYLETPGKCGAPELVAYSDWSVIRTEALVRGRVVPGAAGTVTVQLFLHDVVRQRIVMGKEYQGDLNQVPMIAHRFANEVIKFFTGELGPFGTSISYSSKIGRFKELYVMDVDGSNQRQLTDERSLALSSSWHPSGNSLLFSAFRSRIPDLFSINILSRQISQITRTNTLELGGKYIGFDQGIILSRTQGRSSDIVIIDKAGNQIRSLTRSDGTINVSPSLSPDLSRVAFVSDRAGGPQIYTMGIDGSDVKRVSYVTSSYCTSPAWSPKGDKIAFVCRAERGFHIFVANVDGTNAIQLTSAGDNEDPSWSPDGRYLVFSSTFGKGRVHNLALARIDGGPIRQLTNSRGGDTQPSWGPRLN